MQLDLFQDYLVWDGTEPVQFASATRNSGDVDVLPVAKRRNVRGVEKSPSGGAYAGYEARWIIPQALFAVGFTPKPGDVVIDAAGTTWTVLTTDLGKYGATWILGCVDLVLAEQLKDVIDVQQAAASLDAAGVLVRTWPPDGGKLVAAGLTCRVQPLTQEMKEERGLRGAERHYDVYLSRGVTVDVRECRVSWQGNLLDCVEYKDGNRIDVLPTLTVVQKV